MQVIFKKKRYNGTEKTFFISEGSTITENYNETLDSASIRLSHITEHLDIEPFDRVILRDEEGRLADRYMCVDTYTETMENLDPYIYSYEISLFSETKELENYVLPNLSITKLTDGTHRSVLYYLQQYLALYGPQIRTNSGFIAKFHYLENGYHESFDIFKIDCPEMQWNNPTLREVITDLMMVVDCIPVKRNDIIDFMNLTKKKDPVDTSKVNYIQRSQSAEDYVSELRMDMLNVMQTSIDGVKNTCNRTEYLLWTTDEGIVVTQNNMILKTQFPILNIKHLWMYLQVGCQDRVNTEQETERFGDIYYRIAKMDLCDIDGFSLVHEKQIYDCLKIDRLSDTSQDIDELSTHANYCIYFTRNNNVISGFTNTNKTGDLFSPDEGTFEKLKYILIKNHTDSTGRQWDIMYYAAGLDEQWDGLSRWYTAFFKIEYETTVDTVFQAGRTEAPTHDRIITDNQTNAFVDAYNQGFMEYQKANRLGNQQLHINARYENDYNNILKIGDYYEDSIVFQTQYQIYKNHIEVNASATKDYILRDYFTGVKARIRSWKIADASQALVRHDLNKYYLEFSEKAKQEEISSSTEINPYDFVSPLYEHELEPIRYCGMYVGTESGNFPSGGLLYSVDTIGRIIGNSIVFEFGFEDNYEAGRRVSSKANENSILPAHSERSIIDEGMSMFYPTRLRVNRGDSTSEDFYLKDYGGVLLEPLPYCDRNGEFNFVGYVFVTGIFSNNINLDTASNLEEGIDADFMLSCCKKPVINVSDLGGTYHIRDDKTIKKDNKESFKLSTQFEFCSDTKNIVFTREFLRQQKCISTLVRTDSHSQLMSKSLFGSWTLISETETENLYISSYTFMITGKELVSFESTARIVVGNIVTSIVQKYDNDHLKVTVEVAANSVSDINDFTIAVDYVSTNIYKDIQIYRLPSENYDFKNTNPDLSEATWVGANNKIVISNAYPHSTEIRLQDLDLDPGQTIENSTFYVLVDGIITLILNETNVCYLNLLRSRDQNIYNTNNEPISIL